MEKLDEIVTDLQKYSEIKLDCVGHADSRGTASYNKILAERRAEAVRDYLIAQGISSARLTVSSEGEMNPLAENSTKGGMVQNRRVGFKVLP